MTVSVVIPCRNEVDHIAECIKAIYNNDKDYIKEIEVLVVDGDSTDGTLAVVSSLQTKHPTLKVVPNSKKVTPVAFNLGIKKAKGDYIQIIGARQIISSNYLEKCVVRLENEKSIWCIGGRVINIFENRISEIVAKAMSSPFGVGAGNFRNMKETSFVDTVGTPMYPSWVFEKIGYFDESLVRNQDDDFNFRVTQAGGKILLYNDVSIKYLVRSKFNNLYRQYFQYGYWKVFVNHKHKTITTLRQLVPFLFVTFLLSLPLWYFLSISILYAGILILYFIGALYFGAKSTSKFIEIPVVVFTFWLLHFSYGLGYLNGIIQFILLKKQPSDNSQKLSR